jgi:hypothetical protein
MAERKPDVALQKLARIVALLESMQPREFAATMIYLADRYLRGWR